MYCYRGKVCVDVDWKIYTKHVHLLLKLTTQNCVEVTCCLKYSILSYAESKIENKKEPVTKLNFFVKLYIEKKKIKDIILFSKHL